MHNTTNVGLRRTIQNNNVISSTTTRKKQRNAKDATTDERRQRDVQMYREFDSNEFAAKTKLTVQPSFIFLLYKNSTNAHSHTHTTTKQSLTQYYSHLFSFKKTLTSIPSHSVSVNTLTQHKIPLTMELPYYRHYCLPVVGNLAPALVLSLLFFCIHFWSLY